MRIKAHTIRIRLDGSITRNHNRLGKGLRLVSHSWAQIISPPTQRGNVVGAKADLDCTDNRRFFADDFKRNWLAGSINQLQSVVWACEESEGIANQIYLFHNRCAARPVEAIEDHQRNIHFVRDGNVTGDCKERVLQHTICKSFGRMTLGLQVKALMIERQNMFL